jgi:hypothetical protein
MDLPEELWIEISKYLSLSTWASLYCVCKTFAYMTKYRYIIDGYSYNIRGVHDGWQYYGELDRGYGCIFYQNELITKAHLVFVYACSLVLINNTIYFSHGSFDKQPLPNGRYIELYDTKCLMDMPVLASDLENRKYNSPDFVRLAVCMFCADCDICDIIMSLPFSDFSDLINSRSIRHGGVCDDDSCNIIHNTPRYQLLTNIIITE